MGTSAKSYPKSILRRVLFIIETKDWYTALAMTSLAPPYWICHLQRFPTGFWQQQLFTSNLGPITRQGPHQSAKKSITTSLSPLLSSSSLSFFCERTKPVSNIVCFMQGWLRKFFAGWILPWKWNYYLFFGENWVIKLNICYGHETWALNENWALNNCEKNHRHFA